MVTATRTGGGAVNTQLACGDGAGLTVALDPGTYDVSVAAIDAGGTPLSAPDSFVGRAVQDRNRVTDLGTADLAITPAAAP